MDVAKLFERAESALERNNLDYAVDLFLQILAIEPNFVVARKAVRGVQKRQIQESGVGIPARIGGIFKGIPAFIMVLVFRIANNYERVMIECEKYLACDPANTFVLRMLARAGHNAKYLDSAIVCYEGIVERYPDNVKSLKSLGRLYAAKGDVKRAQFFYGEVSKNDPTDMEADRAVRDLAAIGTIKGGWENAGSFTDVMSDAKGAEKLEAEHKVVRTEEDVDNALARIENDLAESPDDPRLLVKKGDMLVRKKLFDEAEAVYEQVRSADEKDMLIIAKLGDLAIQRMDVVIAELKAKTQPGDDAAKQTLVAKQKQRHEYATKEYERRVTVHPTDLNLRLDYGKLLYAGDQIDEAIAQFQRAIESPKNRKVVINLLGQAFMKKGMYDLAVGQFEKAEAELTVIDDNAKALLYNLGNAHEQLGNLDRAQDYFKRIYESDIGFKDVAKKMETLYERTKGKKGNDADQ